MLWGVVAGRVREGRKSALPSSGKFLKQGLNMAFSCILSKLLRVEVDTWISSFRTGLKFKHQERNFDFWSLYT